MHIAYLQHPAINQQIADELGISVLTVKKQMSLALAYLRTQVTPYAYSLALLLFSEY